MYCSNCSAENSETRKFCGECGFQIAVCCIKCGFPNALSDKFCGGCGINLSSPNTIPRSGTEHQHSSSNSSSYDIKDLLDDTSKSKIKPENKKKKTETENVSQDLIDNIFGPEEAKPMEDEN